MDVSREAFCALSSVSVFAAERFGTWLYRLTVHTCGDFLRKEKKHSNIVPLYAEDDDGKDNVDVPDMRYSPRPRTSAKSSPPL